MHGRVRVLFATATAVLVAKGERIFGKSEELARVAGERKGVFSFAGGFSGWVGCRVFCLCQFL